MILLKPVLVCIFFFAASRAGMYVFFCTDVDSHRRAFARGYLTCVRYAPRYVRCYVYRYAHWSIGASICQLALKALVALGTLRTLAKAEKPFGGVTGVV
eukprot:6181758-Amphidinium_carterae.1